MIFDQELLYAFFFTDVPFFIFCCDIDKDEQSCIMLSLKMIFYKRSLALYFQIFGVKPSSGNNRHIIDATYW